MEPVLGFEPRTDGLQNRCSTTELNWLKCLSLNITATTKRIVELDGVWSDASAVRSSQGPNQSGAQAIKAQPVYPQTPVGSS